MSATPPRSDWKRKAIVTAVVVGAILLVAIVASAAIPRWWSQRIKDQVDGSILMGTLVGLFYGFVFTVLPLLLLVAVLRWARSWRALVIAGASAIVLALPNLLTLAIVLGTGNAAHAAERTLDTDAPAFRGGTLAGALLAAGLVALVAYLTYSRDRARSRPSSN